MYNVTPVRLCPRQLNIFQMLVKLGFLVIAVAGEYGEDGKVDVLVLEGA